MKRLNQEHIIGVVCLLTAAIIFLLTRSFPKGQANINISGPAFFPNLLATIFMLCGIYEVGLGFFQQTGHLDMNMKRLLEGIRKPEVLNVLLIVGLVIFFIVFFEKLGFIPCTFIFLFVLMMRLGVPIVKNLLYTVSFLAIILIIFGRLFSISLPSGILAYIGL